MCGDDLCPNHRINSLACRVYKTVILSSAMTTPLRQQYLQIKKQFPDTIVFFRLGDFYESFDDDAKKVADACNIVLTGRDMGTGGRVPGSYR